MSQISEVSELTAVSPSNIRSSPLFQSDHFKGLTTKFSNEVSLLVQESRPKVLAAKIAQLRALSSLKLFKKEHNLKIDPKYEISPWFTFGSLCTAGSVETALNTSFFSLTSDGLLKAAGTAAQVSAANVLIGFAIGYLLIRYSLHVERKHRLWTVPISLAAFFVGITFNISMGAYREDMMSEDTPLKFFEIYMKAISSIAGRETSALSLDLQSSILILVGLAIFIFSIYKGVKHNDPYPEYASRHLRFLEADEDLILTEQAIRDQVSAAIRVFNDELSQANERALQSSQGENTSVPSADEVQEFLDWQSDRVTKMIVEGEESADVKFAKESHDTLESE